MEAVLETLAVRISEGEVEDLIKQLPPDLATPLERGDIFFSYRLRVQPETRPAGEARYAIVDHGDHSHLAYALELPHAPRVPLEPLQGGRLR